MVKFRTGILTAFAVSALLCACMKEPVADLRTYDCFYAVMEEDADDTADTRAHFEQSAVKWDNNDQIGVYSDTQSSPQVYTRSGSGEFAGNSLSGNTFYAFFPSSGTRSSSTSSYVQFASPDPVFNSNKVRMPMVAYGSGNSLSFKQTCSVLHFFLKSSVSFDRIKLKGNGGEDIAGIGRVNMTSSSPTFSIYENAAKEIVADVPSGVDWKNGVDVYFVIPPVHFYSGFTLTVENSKTTLSKSTTKDVSNVRKKMTRYTLNLDELNHQAEQQYVDLGLSVKWATCNVGATKPEEFGNYYSWGEISQKSNFAWTSYKWCNGSKETLTKYNTSSSYGYVDNITTLEPSDDVATAVCGGGWRMPTSEEFEELCNNCSQSWTTLNGVQGMKFTSKISGYTDKSIFLPAAGYYSSSSSWLDDYHYYWSSSLRNTSYYAYYCRLLSGGATIGGLMRCCGAPVRPVLVDTADYDFFLGTWSVPHGSEYDTWVISPKASGVTYIIQGIDGYSDGMVASYDSNNKCLVLSSYLKFDSTVSNNITYYFSLLGRTYLPDKGQYTIVTGNYDILHAKYSGQDSMILSPCTVWLDDYGEQDFILTSVDYCYSYEKSGQEYWNLLVDTTTDLPCTASRLSTNYYSAPPIKNKVFVQSPSQESSLKYEVHK